MTMPLSFNREPSELPIDKKERHEELVDLFGEFLFWLRNTSLATSRKLAESQAAREKLGSIRRICYDDVADLPEETREAALLFAEESLDGFLERLLWCLGDEGTDSRFGREHAYRFRVELEVVDVKTEEVVEVETINRGGKFFGKYWGRWLNQFSAK